MSKIKVSELKCFGQVADVIGKANAQIELFKVVALSRRCQFLDDECVSVAFVWTSTPQGSRFWDDIDEGINPYDKTLQDQRGNGRDCHTEARE